MGGVKKFEEELKKLGDCTRGKTCLYIKRLDQVDIGVLEGLIRASIKSVKDES